MQNFNQIKPKKHTLDIPIMPQNKKKYTYFVKSFSKFHKKITQKRLFKPLAAGTLALFMGIGTLCGVLIAPANTAAQMQASEEAAAAAQEKFEHDAGIWSGGDLGLDPEKDPVVWVTDNGFEIKSHNVTVSSSTTTVSSTSWKYVTLGSYNWIIIGYSTNALNQSISGYVNVGKNISYNDYFSISDNTNITNKLGSDSSPAGSTIKSECISKNDQIYLSSAVSVGTKLKTIFTNAVGNTEIPAGCVLCLCAGTTGDRAFNNTTIDNYVTSYYLIGQLKTAMTTVYDSISSAAGGAIQLTSLTTLGHDGDSFTTYTHSEYLFPLAYKAASSSQNFCVETYLDTDAKRDLDADWWLRSGSVVSSSNAHRVKTDGKIGTSTVYNAKGVRPAFVLKLY